MGCQCQQNTHNSSGMRMKRTITRPNAPVRNGDAGRRHIDRRVLR